MAEEIKPYGVIYFILNKINGKYYVGQTVRKVQERWINHLSCARTRTGDNHFYRAIHKYGRNNFEIRTLLTVYSKEDLNAAEIYYIAFFNSTNGDIGYNGTLGGEGGIPTQDTRAKQSASGKGRKHPPRTPEHRENLSKALKGRIHTESAKSAHNAALRGRKKSPESVAKTAAGLLGKKRPKSHRGAMREEWKNVPYEVRHQPKGPQTPEHIANIAKGKAMARAKREAEKKENNGGDD